MIKFKQKAIIALGVLICATGLKAQVSPSINCNNAPKATITNSPQTILQGGTNGWFYFISSKRNPDIRLKNLILPNYGGKIISLKAYKGVCNSFTEIATDTISNYNDSLLVLTLNDIKIGDTITLFVKKKYSPQQCTVHPSQCNHDAAFQLNFIETKNGFSTLTNVNVGTLNPNQLILYNKVANQNIYTSINFISIGDIQNIAPLGKLNVNLPSIGLNNITFQMSKVEYNNPSNFNWIGNQYVFDDSVNTYGSINLIRKNEKFIGHITVDNRSYEIFDLTGGLQVICEANLNLFNVKEDCASRTLGVTNGNSTASGPCADGKSKVLILYTPSANSAEPDINGRANLCISDINQIWANSSISNNLTLVSVQPLNFTESSSIGNDINSLAANTTAQNLRNLYQAEIVVLLTNGNYPDAFGVAKGIGAGFSDSYVIVEVTQSTSGRHTFAHEVSHLFNARHELAADNSTSNGKAYLFKTGTGWFGWGGITRKTLMHTIPTGESRIEQVSNPFVNFMNVATGSPIENNAGEVNSFKTQIGGFYPDPVPSSFVFGISKIGCGYTWLGIAEICNGTPYTYNWFVSQNGFSWQPAGTGYINYVFSPWNNSLVKCEVRNPSNVLIYSLQKNLVRFGFGGCSGVAYRQSNQNGQIVNSENEEIIGNSLVNVPNPSNGSFNVELISMSAESEAKIVLTDITGKIVKEIYKGEITVGKQNFKVDNGNKLVSGIYFLKVSGKSLNLVNKIVIE